MPGGNKKVTHICLSMCDFLLPPRNKGLKYKLPEQVPWAPFSGILVNKHLWDVGSCNTGVFV